MVSKVELANMALDILAADNIASLDENSTTARKVKARIDQSIDAVLAMSDWTFARKIASLASVDNDAWPERYEFKYDLPNDMLKAVRLIPEIDLPNVPPISFALANGTLFTNQRDAKLQYTYRNTSISSWPMAFVEAVAAYLARSVAMPITRKRQFFADASSIFVTQLATAVEYDAAQEATFWSYPSEYLEARGSLLRDGDGRGLDGSSYWGD